MWYDIYKDLAIEFIQMEGIDNTEKALGIPIDVLKAWSTSLDIKEGTLFINTFPSSKKMDCQSEIYYGCRIIRRVDEIKEGSELSSDNYAKITDASRKNSFFKEIKKYKWLSVEEANQRFWMTKGIHRYNFCRTWYQVKEKSPNYFLSIRDEFGENAYYYLRGCYSYVSQLHEDICNIHSTNQSFLTCYYIFQYVMRNAPYHTDMWCKIQQEKALKNFDLNMAFFNSLNEDKFNQEIDKFCREHPDFSEVINLNDYTMPGLYIIILDNYKQLYIGMSTDSIKKRIMKHWSNKKTLDRLLWGSVKTSIISIDSFRHYDTTRILAAPHPEYSTQMIDEKEFDLIETAFSSEFLLNRCAGGGKTLQEAVATNRQRKHMG